MKTIDFTQKKAESEGVITPLSLIQNLMILIEEGEIESVMYIAKKKNGEIGTGHTQGGCLEILGMLRCGEEDILNTMRE